MRGFLRVGLPLLSDKAIRLDYRRRARAVSRNPAVGGRVLEDQRRRRRSATTTSARKTAPLVGRRVVTPMEQEHPPEGAGTPPASAPASAGDGAAKTLTAPSTTRVVGPVKGTSSRR